jgi:WD40 repeat protein
MCEKLVWTFRESRGASPPRIAFYPADSDKPIHTIASYNAIGAIACWHPSLALCAVVVRTREKAREQTSLTIYDLRNKGKVGSYIVKDAGEMRGHIIKSCSWDPVSVQEGSEESVSLAVVLSADTGSQLQIYKVHGGAVNKTSAYATSGSRVKFSPAGRFAVADDIDDGSVIVQFYDTSLQAGLIKSMEIDGVEAVDWDPSGVFVMTSSSRQTGGASGFRIWLLDGNQVLKAGGHGFKKCLWRPHASLRLSDQDIEAVRSEAEGAINKYGRFGVVDAKVREEEQRAQKLGRLDRWRAFRGRSGDEYVKEQGRKEFPIQLPIPEPVEPDVNTDVNE